MFEYAKQTVSRSEYVYLTVSQVLTKNDNQSCSLSQVLKSENQNLNMSLCEDQISKLLPVYILYF